MKETLFHAELLAAFRAAGWWGMKWPDQVVSRMQVARDGKMRFALPKPFDLVLCSPEGRFGAIEAKLCRGPILTVDQRLVDQVGTLLGLFKCGAYAVLAVNFRFSRKRIGRVNRAFLVGGLNEPGWGIGEKWHLPLGDGGTTSWLELKRTTGGWQLPLLVEAAWREMNGGEPMMGWECPRCHRCFSPFTMTCWACGPETFSSASTNLQCHGCHKSPCDGTTTACPLPIPVRITCTP